MVCNLSTLYCIHFHYILDSLLCFEGNEMVCTSICFHRMVPCIQYCHSNPSGCIRDYLRLRIHSRSENYGTNSLESNLLDSFLPMLDNFTCDLRIWDGRGVYFEIPIEDCNLPTCATICYYGFSWHSASNLFIDSWKTRNGSSASFSNGFVKLLGSISDHRPTRIWTGSNS